MVGEPNTIPIESVQPVATQPVPVAVTPKVDPVATTPEATAPIAAALEVVSTAAIPKAAPVETELTSATAAPEIDSKTGKFKKPIIKKWWFWAIIATVVVILILSGVMLIMGSSSSRTNVSPDTTFSGDNAAEQIEKPKVPEPTDDTTDPNYVENTTNTANV